MRHRGNPVPPPLKAVPVPHNKTLDDIRGGTGGTSKTTPDKDLHLNPAESDRQKISRLETDLSEAQELLGTLQVAVEGKMIYNPRLSYEDKQGASHPRLLVEMADPWPARLLTLMVLISLLAFAGECAFSLAQHWPRWVCNDLCGGSCTYPPPIGGAGSLENCETAPAVYYNATNSSFFLAPDNCYFHGLMDTWVGLTTGLCNPASIRHRVKAAFAYVPPDAYNTTNATSFGSPVVATQPLWNVTFTDDTPARNYNVCVYHTTLAKWERAAWSKQTAAARFLTVPLEDLTEQRKGLRVEYAQWAGRFIDGTTCVAENGVNFGIPLQDTTASVFTGSAEVSIWTRYIVVVANVINDAQKTETSELADIGDAIATGGSPSWFLRSQYLRTTVDWARLAEAGSITANVTMTYSHGATVVKRQRVRLQCSTTSDTCDELVLFDLQSEYTARFTGEVVSLAVSFEADPSFGLTWEDIDVSVYRIDPFYTMYEVFFRYSFILLTLATIVWFSARVRRAGGFHNLLPEQFWVFLQLTACLLAENPLFLSTLFHRDLNVTFSKVAFVFEVDLGYYAYYVIWCLAIVSLQSARTTTDRPSGKFGPCNGYPTAICLAALVALVVTGAIGRTQQGFEVDGRRARPKVLGATPIQNRAASVLIGVAAYYISYSFYRARRKLSFTHYMPSRRKQLVLRVTTFFTLPVIAVLLASQIVEVFLDHIVSETNYVLAMQEDTLLHRRLGSMGLIAVYSILIALAYAPTLPLVALPPPSYRSTWTSVAWTAEMMKRTTEYCSPYFFFSYQEEMAWLSCQITPDGNELMVTAALVVCVLVNEEVARRGSYQRMRLPKIASNMSFATYDSGKANAADSLRSRNGSIFVDDLIESPSVDSEGTNSAAEAPHVKNPTVHHRHMFSLPLAAEMSILSQEVYFNPPLRVLLKTSKILRKGPTPGCCVLAAAAILPRTLVARSLVAGTKTTKECGDKQLDHYRENLLREETMDESGRPKEGNVVIGKKRHRHHRLSIPTAYNGSEINASSLRMESTPVGGVLKHNEMLDRAATEASVHSCFLQGPKQEEKRVSILTEPIRGPPPLYAIATASHAVDLQDEDDPDQDQEALQPAVPDASHEPFATSAPELALDSTNGNTFLLCSAASIPPGIAGNGSNNNRSNHNNNNNNNNNGSAAADEPGGVLPIPTTTSSLLVTGIRRRRAGSETPGKKDLTLSITTPNNPAKPDEGEQSSGSSDGSVIDHMKGKGSLFRDTPLFDNFGSPTSLFGKVLTDSEQTPVQHPVPPPRFPPSGAAYGTPPSEPARSISVPAHTETEPLGGPGSNLLEISIQPSTPLASGKSNGGSFSERPTPPKPGANTPYGEPDELGGTASRGGVFNLAELRRKFENSASLVELEEPMPKITKVLRHQKSKSMTVVTPTGLGPSQSEEDLAKPKKSMSLTMPSRKHGSQQELDRHRSWSTRTPQAIGDDSDTSSGESGVAAESGPPTPTPFKLQRKKSRPRNRWLETSAKIALQRKSPFMRLLPFFTDEKDAVQASCDEYKFEMHDGWTQNISRSFMDLRAIGYDMKYLLDRKNNRVIIATKHVGNTDRGDEVTRTPCAESGAPRPSRPPKAPPIPGFVIIAVVFRGTRNTANIKTDLSIQRVAYDEVGIDDLEMADAHQVEPDHLRDGAREHGVRGSSSPRHASKAEQKAKATFLGTDEPCVHTGFVKTWQFLKEDVLQAIKEELKAVEGRRVRVVCAGHSMGGALATLAAYSVKKAHPSLWVSLYSFGTPRIGNPAFCKKFDKIVPDAYRVTNPADPVPNHPPKLVSQYSHPGTKVVVDEYGNILVKANWIELTFLEMVPFSLLEIFPTNWTLTAGHSMKSYRTALMRVAHWAGQDHGLQQSLDRA
ncbi:Phospholipase A1-II 1 [Diplonema papillatum]|nr:Phospholipase A1-II 1 [Diplonema papillatum]